MRHKFVSDWFYNEMTFKNVAFSRTVTTVTAGSVAGCTWVCVNGATVTDTRTNATPPSESARSAFSCPLMVFDINSLTTAFAVLYLVTLARWRPSWWPPLYTDSHVTTDSHVGNKDSWAFTVNCSGIILSI